MTPYFPALPESKPANPTAYGLAGYGAVQDIEGRQTTNALSQMQLGKEQQRQSALAEYAKTGDIGEVSKIDPEFGLKLQSELRKMNADERKTAMEALSHGADFMTKALPFVNEQNYPAFAQDAAKVPVLRGLVPPKFNQEWIDNAKKMTADAKTAVARVMQETAANKLTAQVAHWNDLTQIQKDDLARKGVHDENQFKHWQAEEEIQRGKGGKEDKDLDIKLLRDINKIDTTAKRQINSMPPHDREDPTKTQPILDQAEADKKAMRAAYEKRRGGAGKGGGSEPKPTEQDVPINTRRRSADGTYWRNDNGVITKEQ